MESVKNPLMNWTNYNLDTPEICHAETHYCSCRSLIFIICFFLSENVHSVFARVIFSKPDRSLPLQINPSTKSCCRKHVVQLRIIISLGKFFTVTWGNILSSVYVTTLPRFLRHKSYICFDHHKISCESWWVCYVTVKKKS